ncbi:MAG: cytochrome c [Verrucomicrobiota bacterium]|nr:cytochrome c [Verrucomicrobiota bacterium]
MKFLRYFFFAFVLSVLTVVIIAGYRGQITTKEPIEIFPDMDRQLKIKGQTTSEFYADGYANRPAVSGTVPHVPAAIINYETTGKMGKNWGTGIPVKVTLEKLKRGQERYQINCAVCHGASGNGKGITSQYGLVGIANLNDDRLVQMSDGQIYNTIAHGIGNMGAYPHISVEDRWLIIAYVRALQKQQKMMEQTNVTPAAPVTGQAK